MDFLKRQLSHDWHDPDLQPNDFAYARSFGERAHLEIDGPITLWAKGYQLNLAVDKPGLPTVPGIGLEDGLDGSLTGAMAGLDVRIGDGFLLGASLSSSRADLDFGGEIPGTYEAEVRGVHPYFGWQLKDGGQVWGAVGIGKGQVDIYGELGGHYGRDIDWQQLAAGGQSPIKMDKERLTLSLVGDGFISRMSVDEPGGLDVTAARLRFGLEADYRRKLQTTDFGASMTLAARQDAGDALEGAGMEMGGGLSLAFPGAGLKLAFKARTLLAHEAAVSEWGVAGGVEWSRNKGGKGLSLAFKPQWGAPESRSDEVWEQTPDERRQSQNPSDNAGPSYTLEVKYGMEFRSSQERMTFFASSDRRADRQTLSVGAKYSMGQGFTAEYEATYEQGAPQPEHRAQLRYERRF